MQLTILGGGGFRVPLVYRALCADRELQVDRLVLYDVEPDRLAVVANVLEHVAGDYGAEAPRVATTTDLVEAVRGSDFVFSAIRVAGATGRICDERSALAHGVLGQETTGAGGVCYGLRTVPKVLRVARIVADVAPQAWVINFTNPAGMVTEAMRSVLGDRVVGICDSPVGLFRRVARALEVDPARVEFDYAGLNHLGWLRAAVVDGRDRLPDLLADTALLRRIEEGRLFGASWLQSLGVIPNEYLWYWYFRTDALGAEQAAEHTRGEFIGQQQAEFYADALEAGPEQAYTAWEQARLAREQSYMADSRQISGSGERDPYDLDGGGYDQVALAVMRAVATGQPATVVLNVANRGTLPFLDDDAVVEVPCHIDASGPRPLPVGALDLHAAGLVAGVKAVERIVLEAAVTGSRRTAVKALALHPLVGSVPVARGILADQLETLPELARVLANP
jgi:6-phospho-beta-glucosidase